MGLYVVEKDAAMLQSSLWILCSVSASSRRTGWANWLLELTTIVVFLSLKLLQYIGKTLLF